MGGAAGLCGASLQGASRVLVPPLAHVANAIGAAIPQVNRPCLLTPGDILLQCLIPTGLLLQCLIPTGLDTDLQVSGTVDVVASLGTGQQREEALRRLKNEALEKAVSAGGQAETAEVRLTLLPRPRSEAKGLHTNLTYHFRPPVLLRLT